ncbi:RHS repeat-associated core domain-containing protein, partial [Chryseobacterium elymi]
MTKVNDPANLNGKLFGYEMRYTNPVYSNVAPGRFNGNIAEIDWNNASENVLKRYNYGYDNLNRLKDAIYTEPGSTNPYNNNFNENLTYDLNGNIMTLKRNAFPIFGTTSTLVDDLAYQYTGNRLDKVIENSLNDTGYEGGNNLIDYDLNGNMITMKDKGIQTIAYNYLNLPNDFQISQLNPFGIAV